MTALLPALLVALSAAWSGTFRGGATWSGALIGDVAVIAFALAAAPRLRDPLQLGRGAEVLLWALVVTAVASLAVSPVPRAGLDTLVLLPAYLLVPASTERVWRDARRRRVGVGALSLVATAIAGWALIDAVVGSTWRAAAPIGHHGALSIWLLFLLPFAALTARHSGAWRAVGLLAMVSIAACIVATRSLAGIALLVVQIGILLGVRRARWWSVGVAAVVAVALLAPRLIAIASGADPSLAARGAYLEAGVRGVLARPALGWGPGSVGWTIGEHLHAAPGRNPPGEVISYLHFLPLDVAYQLGFAGALLAIAVAIAFLVARRRERAPADDAPLLDAATASLVPGLLGLCFAGFQPLSATVIATAVAGGAALAATATRRPALSDRSRRAALAVVLLYSACALGVLVPVRRAQRLYDAARTASDPFALLDRATAHDKSFPLYVARRAWAPAPPDSNSAETLRAADTRAAGEALRAAERAPGVAALWLAAGVLGADAGSSWSVTALKRACDLDPMGALAPFRLMTIESSERAAALAGARALLAEPRLAAAIEWESRDPIYRRALSEIERWPGVAADWRRRAVTQLAALPAFHGGATRAFHLELDSEAQTSLSLFVFRRLPWPTRLAAIELDAARLSALKVGAAAARADTAAWAFPKNGCGGAEPSRR